MFWKLCSNNCKSLSLFKEQLACLPEGFIPENGQYRNGLQNHFIQSKKNPFSDLLHLDIVASGHEENFSFMCQGFTLPASETSAASIPYPDTTEMKNVISKRLPCPCRTNIPVILDNSLTSLFRNLNMDFFSRKYFHIKFKIQYKS